MPAREYVDSRVVADSRQYATGRGAAVGRLVVEPIVDPYADYLVYDTLTDDDGVLITAHAPEKDAVGGGWIVINGAPANLTINSNQFLIAISTVAGSGWSLIIIDPGAADCVITGHPILAGANPAIMFRATDDDNMWIMNFGVTANLLRLFKRDTTVQTTEDSVAQVYNVTDVISFRITLAGNNILCEDLTNGVSVSTVDAFNNAVTTHGCGENNGANLYRVEDFFVQ